MTDFARFSALPPELRQMIWIQAATIQLRIKVEYSSERHQPVRPFRISSTWHPTDQVSYKVRLPRSIALTCRESCDILFILFRPDIEHTQLPAWFQFELDDVSTCFFTILHLWREPWTERLQHLTFCSDDPADAFGGGIQFGPMRPHQVGLWFPAVRSVTIDVHNADGNLVWLTDRSDPRWTRGSLKHWTDGYLLPMLDFCDGQWAQLGRYKMRIICTGAPRDEWLTRRTYLRVRYRILVRKAYEARPWFEALD